MAAKVQMPDNGRGRRLSTVLRKEVEIAGGPSEKVAVREEALVVVPIRGVRGKLDLKDLVSRIPKDHKPKELDWGPRVGGEAW